MSIENGFFYLALASFILFAFAQVSFARLSVSRIEKAMLKDGLGKPCPWDSFGARIPMIAFAITFPPSIENSQRNPLIDSYTVNRYSTLLDRRLAIFSLASGVILVAVAVIGSRVLTS